jgi:hypothetical protein
MEKKAIRIEYRSQICEAGSLHPFFDNETPSTISAVMMDGAKVSVTIEEGGVLVQVVAAPPTEVAIQDQPDDDQMATNVRMLSLNYTF